MLCSPLLRPAYVQVDENKKTHDRLNDLVEKLQQKLKVCRRQVEEAVSTCTAVTFTSTNMACIAGGAGYAEHAEVPPAAGVAR